MDNQRKPPCCGEVVENTANGKEFFYCRGCKQEVTWPVLEDASNGDEMLDLFKKWQALHGNVFYPQLKKVPTVTTAGTTFTFPPVQKRSDSANCAHDWKIYYRVAVTGGVTLEHECYICGLKRQGVP